ncbi:hypothetical protein [uncultured Cellulomonas sp.]|uniref:hypothetical protein n=1 Tax=uncultured Cellulomonas sp. TaxID=189682 RepID=UPI0028E7FAB5|nr:hypothetical protein [uncultured Cellulomonas sp.]
MEGLFVLKPAALLAAVWATAGCALLPSDPVRPPVGLRQDGDVLTVLIPDCPGVTVVGAAVTSRSSDATSGLPSWTATGFIGEVRNGVALDTRDWSEVDGSYAGLAAVDIEIDTGTSTYGTVVEPPRDREDLESLPVGHYDVGGEVVEAAEYFDRVADDYPCPTPT